MNRITRTHALSALALAAGLCAALPAAAQHASPGVTGSEKNTLSLYGRVDLGVGRIAKDLTVNEDVLTSVRDSSTGRWGIRGTRELAYGLTGLFNLEHRFKADEGTQDGTVYWKDKAFVGVAHPVWGTVTLGRQSSPMDNRGVNGRFEAFGGDSLGSNGDRGAKMVAKWDNSVYWQSPVINGFSVGAAKAFKEKATAIRSNVAGVQGEYVQGPVAVSLTWQADANTTDDWTTTSLGASYDLGVAKLMAVYARSEDQGANDDGQTQVFTLGSQIPAGPGQIRISLQQYKDNAALGDARKQKYSVGYQLPLDKNTTLNLSLADQNYKKAAVDNSALQYEAAVRYNF
ncbi:MAG: hypothetical protein RLY78_1133 [Pseudomonadota bacterium]|jgi:predicted porin